MINTRKKLMLPVIALVLFLGLSAAVVLAQNNQNAPGNGFRISPVRAEYTLERGSTEQLTISLTNPINSAVRAEVVVNNFIASDDETGDPKPILDESGPVPKNNFKTLVSVVEEVALEPQEQVELPVTLRIPENANPGGYYGVIRFEPIPNSEDEGTVALTASVGTIVLVRVPGDLTEKVTLEQLSAAQNGEPQSFFTGGDVSVITRLNNEGDIHLKPFGKIIVSNMFGNTVAEYELNNTDPRANVLPGSIRKFVDELPSQNWFGRYTITANIGYSQGSGELISASTAFWYMPVWSILLLVVLIGAIVWLVVRTARKTNARRHRLATRTRSKK